MIDSNHKYIRDHLIFLSDPNTSKVVENDLTAIGPDKRKSLRTEISELNDDSICGIKDSMACVNTFALKGNADVMPLMINSKRWESFKNLITKKVAPIDMDGMKKIMFFTNSSNNSPGKSSDSSICNTGTTQSIVFKPDTFTLEVAFAPRGKSLQITQDYLSIPVNFK